MIDVECSARQLRESLTAIEEGEKCAKLDEDFDSLVAKLQKKGYSKEYATKIAGKVAKEKGDIKGAKEGVLNESGHVGGSDEMRGKNQAAQRRAMWYKDPENPYADEKKKSRKGRKGKRRK